MIMWVEPGHFYSPITTDTNFKHFGDEPTIPGVDLRPTAQKSIAKMIYTHYKDVSFDRYYYDNDQFGEGDAITLFCMLKTFQPQRIIEVGSGFSSAVMLDTGVNSLTCIDPYADRLRSLLRDDDPVTVIEDKVQNVDLSMFDKLKIGDVLFIDSSHVAKAGSDVNWIYFQILPRLAQGVIIHIHDILYPFEYHDTWIRQGRSWNEAYIVHALLMGTGYRMLLWPNYLAKFYPEVYNGMDTFNKNHGGSLWIIKE